jgi:2-methylisocitrate lyase-like PEP mutase family enzyme
VNALAGSSTAVTVAQLADAGVRRISLGSSLARVALSAALRAARELREAGTFGFAGATLSYAEINQLMGKP